jgi:hypothetical protein
MGWGFGHGRGISLWVNWLLFRKFLISFYKNHYWPVKGKDALQAKVGQAGRLNPSFIPGEDRGANPFP